MNNSERRDNLIWVKNELEKLYGPIEKDWGERPLRTLVQTVLSQNTNDDNRDRAERDLWSRFTDYEDLATAPVSKIADAISTGGLQNQKAKTIKGILSSLAEKGKYSLDYLKSLDPEEAWKELMSFDGVGKKTAAVVLLFSLDKPIFPVDTHVRRVTGRLGLVMNGEKHHETLTELVRDDDMFQFHLHLIQHGRETCKARNPRCEDCVLVERCPAAEGFLG
ncbi:MAG: endonuclease III domain-containing protein [Candidatus Bipolaricaulota bacterium]